jgi:hypothetical protein
MPTTKKERAAARANRAKSLGPETAGGKARIAAAAGKLRRTLARRPRALHELLQHRRLFPVAPRSTSSPRRILQNEPTEDLTLIESKCESAPKTLCEKRSQFAAPEAAFRYAAA